MTYEEDLDFRPPHDNGISDEWCFVVAAAVIVVGVVAFFVSVAVFG